MRYEAPEVTALKPAIDAIHSTPATKGQPNSDNAAGNHDVIAAYEDWE